jgi:hypothetical protein
VQDISAPLEGASRSSEFHDESGIQPKPATPSGESDPNTTGRIAQIKGDTPANETEAAKDQNLAEVSTDSLVRRPLRTINAATQTPRHLGEQTKLKLLSLHFSRNIELWLAGLSAIVSAAFLLMYWNGVVSPRSVMVDFLKVDPKWTLFLIVLTGNITTALLNRFIETSFEKLKWKLSLRAGGVALLEFMALSRSTSWWTLTKLLFARRSKSFNGSRLQIVMSYLEHFRVYSICR